jgi:O-antigen ligase
LIKGIFDGFILLSALQVILAICFPLLGINFVTGLFHTYGTEWSTRLGGREGALGFFGHPGNFAIYLIISSSFFLGSYFEGFNKRKCQLFICINTFSLYLTYSRISFLSFIGILFILFLIKSNPKKSLFTFKNVLFYILPAFLVIYFIVFESSLSDLFLKGDANQQVDNRMVHWIVSTKIFFESPLLGVGLNSHLAYISKNTGLINSLTSDDFFSKNPIHNIHLIILSELGIIGFICWVVFLISNIAIAKKNIANDSNNILSFTLIGVVLAYIFNGVTGWGPLSPSLLPFFLFFCFFARKFSV